MEDMVLRAEIGGGAVLYVSPIDRQTYDEHIEDDNLGGGEGYFIIKAQHHNGTNHFEILAKAASFAAAGDIFDLIVGANATKRIGN
jgi:hypothetical protein